ncbi:Uncharacterised protein [Mammaliicoccus fleurettii]|nr:Uncharacterised protein [Mammaliicoccus fleurettii]
MFSRFVRIVVAITLLIFIVNAPSKIAEAQKKQVQWEMVIRNT